jgi:hypothetical protein
MQTAGGKQTKLSDFQGKYLLLAFLQPGDPVVATFKQLYSEYTPDDRLSLLTVTLGVGFQGRTMLNSADYPWHQASLIMNQATAAILTTNFALNSASTAWLIGPDGKVVAGGLKGDAIQSAVTAAVGPPLVPAVSTTEPSTTEPAIGPPATAP